MIEEEVKRIIARQMNIEPETINSDTNFFKDLNADSLDAVEIVLDLEERFGIEVPDDEADHLETVKAVAKFIEKELDKADFESERYA